MFPQGLWISYEPLELGSLHSTPLPTTAYSIPTS